MDPTPNNIPMLMQTGRGWEGLGQAGVAAAGLLRGWGLLPKQRPPWPAGAHVSLHRWIWLQLPVWPSVGTTPAGRKPSTGVALTLRGTFASRGTH